MDEKRFDKMSDDKMSEPMRNAYNRRSTEWPTVSEWKRMRNKEIVRLFDDEHVTMKAMAGWFGISKQRVYQIYKDEKESVPVLKKYKSHNVFKKMRDAEIVHMIDQRHMTKTAVAKWFNISKQRVQQIYKREKESVQDIRPTGDGEDNSTS